MTRKTLDLISRMQSIWPHLTLYNIKCNKYSLFVSHYSLPIDISYYLLCVLDLLVIGIAVNICKA